MKKLFNLLLVSIFMVSGLFILTGCNKNESGVESKTPTNVEKYRSK